MAFSGMTGFARIDGAGEGVRWTWEARSVNGRALDLKAKLPLGFDALEPALRSEAYARFKRGSLQVALSVRREAEAPTAFRIDTAFVDAVVKAGAAYVESGEVERPRWDGLMALRGAVIQGEAPAEEGPSPALLAALTTDLAAVLEVLLAARRQEGAGLRQVLGGQVEEIARLVAEAEAVAADAPEALRDRLLKRLEPLLGETPLDPQRLAQEAAILAAKADVREELDRLRAHVREARALLDGTEPAGRKLDFLVQELNREANTLCSKASEMALTSIGLALKAVIDQFREQASNVE